MQNWQILDILKCLKFYETLTNDVVSFEQPGPDFIAVRNTIQHGRIMPLTQGIIFRFRRINSLKLKYLKFANFANNSLDIQNG